ncbi:MAG TPA: 1-deoxy-D-xylulose-5-phosphate reductoisomerase [Vicinamibacterales bacterium]
MKRIAILGSTGSIGTSALAVVDAYPDRLSVAALAASTSVDALARQAARYRPAIAAIASEACADRLRSSAPQGTAVVTGPEGLLAVATHPDVDLLLCASSGTAALEAVLAGIESGKTIAIANKEVLVMAGALVTRAARRHGVALLPVDSEHNAIHQCLHGRSPADVRRLVLTASGGPFRGWPAERLAGVTPDMALRHPTWQMGRKITIDSATLMNKGLEVIEAHWLFDVPADRIDVVVHPQSIVHSMVELTDGSTIAQLGVTDMRLPIQYAFSYPERWDAMLPPLDLTRCGPLEFLPPDPVRFPCLGLAYRALRTGGTMPIVLNAANEVAVEAFLGGRLAFPAIAQVIEQTMTAHDVHEADTLEEVRAVDRWARARAAAFSGTLELKVQGTTPS